MTASNFFLLSKAFFLPNYCLQTNFWLSKQFFLLNYCLPFFSWLSKDFFSDKLLPPNFFGLSKQFFGENWFILSKINGDAGNCELTAVECHCARLAAMKGKQVSIAKYVATLFLH